MIRRTEVRTWFRTAILCLAALAASPAPSPAAIDPFYSSLLERGARELASGRPAEAARLLQTACFGMLEDPVLLTECLMQLTRAHSTVGDPASVRNTVNRIVQMESRFGAYSELAESDAKARFREALQTALTAGELTATGLIAPAPPTTEPTAMEPAEAVEAPRRQRRRLEGELEGDPGNRELLWELATLEVSTGRLKRAATLLDGILDNDPSDQPALCFRAEIAAVREECAAAVTGLESCPGLLAVDSRAAFTLECLAVAGNQDRAREIWASLPDERRLEPAFADLTARFAPVEAQGQPSKATDTEGLSGTNTNVPIGRDGLDQDTSPADELPPPAVEINIPLKDRIRRIRTEAAAAQVRSDLADPMSRARNLADEFLDSVEAQHLVAEIAFRSADYGTAIDYFARGGRPATDQHVLLFFLAVSMYETGDLEGAQQALAEALPRLEASEPTDYVRSYIDRILGPPPE